MLIGECLCGALRDRAVGNLHVYGSQAHLADPTPFVMAAGDCAGHVLDRAPFVHQCCPAHQAFPLMHAEVCHSSLHTTIRIVVSGVCGGHSLSLVCLVGNRLVSLLCSAPENCRRGGQRIKPNR